MGIKSLEVRPAAKCIIDLPGGKFLFVSGRQGILNLVGGGIDKYEADDPIKAFFREAYEEIGLTENHFNNIRSVGEIVGPVTTAEGREKIAKWTVFRASLIFPASEIYLPGVTEIKAVHSLTRNEVNTDTHMSNLARRAIDILAEK